MKFKGHRVRNFQENLSLWNFSHFFWSFFFTSDLGCQAFSIKCINIRRKDFCLRSVFAFSIIIRISNFSFILILVRKTLKSVRGQKYVYMYRWSSYNVSSTCQIKIHIRILNLYVVFICFLCYNRSRSFSLSVRQWRSSLTVCRLKCDDNLAAWLDNLVEFCSGRPAASSKWLWNYLWFWVESLTTGE